ncbi:MAG: nucleotidyltransferase substrate binding protein [Bdellovibrionota bacterium]|mgnify:CR=1 FL=1
MRQSTKTEKNLDIRWKQRLKNFVNAFGQLQKAIKLSKTRELSELEKQGLIKAFEFTHELAWNVLRDYFDFQGGGDLITGSRDATREAFSRGLIADGDVWMEMIKSRNQTSHTYNKNVAEEITRKICNEYFFVFELFLQKMTEISQNE